MAAGDTTVGSALAVGKFLGLGRSASFLKFRRFALAAYCAGFTFHCALTAKRNATESVGAIQCVEIRGVAHRAISPISRRFELRLHFGRMNPRLVRGNGDDLFAHRFGFGSHGDPFHAHQRIV